MKTQIIFIIQMNIHSAYIIITRQKTGDPKVVETFAENITKDNQYESGFQIDKIKINSNCWYLNFLWSNWDLFPNDGIYKAQSSLLNSFSPAYNQ